MRRWLLGIVVLVVLGLGTSDNLAAQSPITINGEVSGPGAGPVPDVVVDLFLADESGNRIEYLRSASTDDLGSYRFELESSGCRSLVFIAPAGSSFGGSRYFQDVRCLSDGESARIDVELQDSNDLGTLEVAVADTAGVAVPDVAVDLFAASADGSRGRYLRSKSTGPDGSASFQTPVGCYIVVAIAPPGDSFSNGTPWWQTGRCVDAGASEQVDVALAPSDQGGYEGRMTDGRGTPFADVVIDVFAAAPDGSRGEFLFDTTTFEDGTYRIDLSAGCYVTVAIAPDGLRFIGTGPYLVDSFCLEPGQVRTANGLGNSLVDPNATGSISVVFQGLDDRHDITVNTYRSNHLGDRFEQTDSVAQTSGPYNQFRLEYPTGCIILEFLAPEGTTFPDQSTEISGWYCLFDGTRRDRSTYLIPGNAIPLDSGAGIAYVPEVDRLVLTGDDQVQIRSSTGEVLHTIVGLVDVRQPVPTGNGRVVVVVKETNELVVIDAAAGVVERRIDPGPETVDSMDVADGVIWYHHGVLGRSSGGIGRVGLDGTGAVQHIYEGDTRGSAVQVTPTRPDRVYLVRSGSPKTLMWFGPDEAEVLSPSHSDHRPFAVTDDGEVWALNGGAIVEFDPDDLTPTGRSLAVPPGFVVRAMIIDDAAIHLVSRRGVVSYDRSTLEQIAEVDYLGLSPAGVAAVGNLRAAVVSSDPFSTWSSQYHLIIDRIPSNE